VCLSGGSYRGSNAAANAGPEMQMRCVVLNFLVQELLILLGMSEANMSRNSSKHASACANTQANVGGSNNWKGQRQLAKAKEWACWKGSRAALKSIGKLEKQKAHCHAGRGGAAGDRGGRQQRSSHKRS